MKLLEAKEYQPRCLVKFEHYKTEVLRLLPNARVEHVGASSIPNALSKGDLDILVGVGRSEFESAVTTLKRLNFGEKQDTLRTNELCMLESLNVVDVALQVIVNGSEFETFLSFRDRLLDEPVLVSEYNELKLRCVGMTPQAYRVNKSAFITRVLAG